MIDAPPEPPCPPGTAPAAELRAHDLEDGGGPLTATHTISLELESSEGPIDEFGVEAPAGVRVLRAGPTWAFQSDAAGAVPIRATWSHYVPEDGGYECTASTEATFTLDAARPLRYAGPPRRDIQMNSLEWFVRFGRAGSDLRPVQMRLRGVRRTRLPRGTAPFETVTFSLRRGDRGLRQGIGSGRTLRSAGWRFHAGYLHDDEIRILMWDVPTGRRLGFGFELELVQAGRVIGRTSAVGRCRYLTCGYRTARRPAP